MLVLVSVLAVLALAALLLVWFQIYGIVHDPNISPGGVINADFQWVYGLYKVVLSTSAVLVVAAWGGGVYLLKRQLKATQADENGSTRELTR